MIDFLCATSLWGVFFVVFIVIIIIIQVIRVLTFEFDLFRRRTSNGSGLVFFVSLNKIKLLFHCAVSQELAHLQVMVKAFTKCLLVTGIITNLLING